MINRFPSVRPLDYCFSPIRVKQEDDYVTVPCGKCYGCLLHKSNSWEFRLEDEILNCPFPLFFTLTYYNKYLPHFTLYKCSLGASGSRFYHYTTDSVYSYRHLRRVWSRTKQSFYEVERDEDIDDIVTSQPINIPIENLKYSNRGFYFGYTSKRDIQLFKKQLKSLILDYVQSSNLPASAANFRSFIISEYGPKTFRGHYHGVLFFSSQEVAYKVQSDLLAKAWPMQDIGMLQEYCSLTNRGVGEYVSSYVTQFSLLPKIIGQNRQIRPFRLSSKSPAIGFSPFVAQEIYEQVSCGFIEFNKTIPDVDQDFILRYPALYCSRLFPKCRGFRFLSFEGLLRIYGVLWRTFCTSKSEFYVISKRLRDYLSSQDYYCALACFRFCFLYPSPFYYVHLVDMYYYKVAMLNLRDWYQWQSEQLTCGNVFSVIQSYSNLYDLLHSLSPSIYLKMALEFFSLSFGLSSSADLRNLSYSDFFAKSDSDIRYSDEVTDIVLNLDKSRKVNEFLKVSPTKNLS